MNLNDTPLLHEWAELDHISVLEHVARDREAAKLTAADLDAADARRAGALQFAPTTRRFPRSLAEAFPIERAEAIERPARPVVLRIRDLAWLSAAVAFAVGALAYNLAGPQ